MIGENHKNLNFNKCQMQTWWTNKEEGGLFSIGDFPKRVPERYVRKWKESSMRLDSLFSLSLVTIVLSE